MPALRLPWSLSGKSAKPCEDFSGVIFQYEGRKGKELAELQKAGD